MTLEASVLVTAKLIVRQAISNVKVKSIVMVATRKKFAVLLLRILMGSFVRTTLHLIAVPGNVMNLWAKFYVLHMKTYLDVSLRLCAWSALKMITVNSALVIQLVQSNANRMKSCALVVWTIEDARMLTCALQREQITMAIFAMLTVPSNVPIQKYFAKEK
jgi:hypothetical protein